MYNYYRLAGPGGVIFITVFSKCQAVADLAMVPWVPGGSK